MPSPSPKILVVGAGPCGIGAAIRLTELGYSDWTLINATDRVGGLADSVVTDDGFTWDYGGHVVFGHYRYYDDVLEFGGTEMQCFDRRCYVFMDKGTCKVNYPLQLHVDELPERFQERCRVGLELAKQAPSRTPTDFYDWALMTQGQGLVDVFMEPYNLKVWAYPLRSLSATWIGERVAVAPVEEKKVDVVSPTKASQWGPNSAMRYPKEGGVGAAWRSVLSKLDQSKVKMNTALTALNEKTRTYQLSDGTSGNYDFMISTIPLPVLTGKILPPSDTQVECHNLAKQLKYSSTKCIGLGVMLAPGSTAPDFHWAYFPDDDCPFYRCTVLTNYSSAMAPDNADGSKYSLLFEVSHSSFRPTPPLATVAKEAEEAAKAYGLIGPHDKVISRWSEELVYGYPTPSSERDAILGQLLPKLEETYGVVSRGRFGAWKYEVGNMDHSMMQGVEAVDHILKALKHCNIPAEKLVFAHQPTLHSPSLVNSPSNRSSVTLHLEKR